MTMQHGINLNAHGRSKSSIIRVSMNRHRETEWIKENRSKYADHWVVVEGSELIAADPDGHKAFVAAKSAGIAVPFLVHILPDDPLPFVAGW